MKRNMKMAGSKNLVILIGNVGGDPEIRSTPAGKTIASFSLATNETWTDKASGEKKERSEWHRIVVFNDHFVSVVERFVKKGDKLYIEGSLKTRKWQAQDGSDRYITEVQLQAYGGDLVLLGSPNGRPSDAGSAATTRGRNPTSPSGDQPPAPDLEDEIPF
jgi:single-strand DNA-binding protein